LEYQIEEIRYNFKTGNEIKLKNILNAKRDFITNIGTELK